MARHAGPEPTPESGPEYVYEQRSFFETKKEAESPNPPEPPSETRAEPETHSASESGPQDRSAPEDQFAGRTALVAEAVTVRYGATIALNAVTLRARAGELVAVTGPSGAGKTTLLEVLAAVRPPDEGRIDYADSPVRNRDQAVTAGIALIPQGNSLLAVLTALENVALPLLNRRSGRPGDARGRAVDALTAVGLEEAQHQLPDELSGGQQQRVAIARGLAESADVLLADEPTSELDSTNRNLVMTLLRAEADRGRIVIFATHDPEAADTADAQLHLDEGTAHWIRPQRD